MCAEVLESLGLRDDRQSQISHAEVITVPLVAALFHRSNHALARRALHEGGYIKVNLSASRFCRRLRSIPESGWQLVFALLAQVFVQSNGSGDYAVDSMPILVCQNVRISRCRLFPAKEHKPLRGYQASKKRFFWGFKVHMVATRQGEPVEFLWSEGSLHDLEGLRRLSLNLPAGSTLYGDKAYFDTTEETLMSEAGQFRLVALRRKNAKVSLPPALVALCHTVRQQIESAFSVITQTLPLKLHAIAPQGFLIKLNALIIAYAFYCLTR